MKLKILLPIAPLVAVLLAGCGDTDGRITLKSDQQATFASQDLTAAPVGTVIYPDDRPSIADGKAWFTQQNCASCHSADGRNTPTGAKAALSDPLWAGKRRPVEQFIFLAYGSNNVKGHEKPLRELLRRNQIWDLVAYTRSMAAPALTKDEMDAILPVFGANCAVCHGTKGDGDGPLMRNLEPMPANFQTFSRFYDRDDDTLFDHIANGIRWEGMPNFLGKKDTRNKVEFDQKYIRKLVAYVRAFHFRSEATTTANLKPVATTSEVGGTKSLPPTAANDSDLGLKQQIQPEQEFNAAGIRDLPSSSETKTSH
jgi:mono/diheme cytochrome c family protein